LVGSCRKEALDDVFRDKRDGLDVTLSEFSDGFRVNRPNRWHTAVANVFVPAPIPDEDIRGKVTAIPHKAGLTMYDTGGTPIPR
jgi:hypothetical protein